MYDDMYNELQELATINTKLKEQNDRALKEIAHLRKEFIPTEDYTTFNNIKGIHMMYVNFYKCAECGNHVVYRLNSDFDFLYCPYCGREVKTPEEW